MSGNMAGPAGEIPPLIVKMAKEYLEQDNAAEFSILLQEYPGILDIECPIMVNLKVKYVLPLVYSCVMNKPKIRDLLVASEAGTRIDRKGNTPALDLCRVKYDDRIVKSILLSKCDVNHVNKAGLSCVHYVRGWEKWGRDNNVDQTVAWSNRMINILKENGADVDSITTDNLIESIGHFTAIWHGIV